ncbi:MAG: Uma2 family endonuclease, partial [Solobacterium sp.]|nr:Uma2 family endonuclease [Solobacterium sp.]
YYGAPELVIDVIGHGNEQSTYGSKLFKYRENGVSEYIIVDPMRKIVFDYDFKNNNTEVNKLPCDLSVQMFNGLCRLKIRP